MDRLGVDRFALLGHSMGGMIAQEIAHKSPQRVEVLILFGTGPEGELPGRFEPIAESRRKVIEPGYGTNRLLHRGQLVCEGHPRSVVCTVAWAS